MRLIVVLALAMVFAAPIKNADASSHMTGDMSLSQGVVDCQTSPCCRSAGKSAHDANQDSSDSNNCGSEFNCGSCASFSGEVMSKEKFPFDSITRIAPDYSRLLTSLHLVTLERPPKHLS